MVNPISLVILLASFVTILLSLLIQYVADARNPQSDHRIHPSGLDVIWPRAVSRPIDLLSIVSLRLFNLLIFWSKRLLLIFYFWNHDFFAFKHRIIQMFLLSEAFAFFLHLIDYWYSHQLCRESPDPLLGCYPTVSFTSKILSVFPWYIIPSVYCIICFDFDTLLSNSYLFAWLMVV